MSPVSEHQFPNIQSCGFLDWDLLLCKSLQDSDPEALLARMYLPGHPGIRMSIRMLAFLPSTPVHSTSPSTAQSCTTQVSLCSAEP